MEGPGKPPKRLLEASGVAGISDFDGQQSRVDYPPVKEGVDFVFEQNPELASLGTREQYSHYLETIFPESKVRNVVWHSSLKDFKEGSFKPESHFGTKNQAKSRIGFVKQVTTDFLAKEYFYPTLLDIKNNKEVGDADYNWKEEITKAEGEGFDSISYENQGEVSHGGVEKSYVIFNPQQAYILGSKSDLEKFREFVAAN